MTVTELKDYMASKKISGVVVNIVNSFHHITFTDTDIVFYNNDDENNHTSATDRLTIPIKEIKEIDFSETSKIITLYPFARLILVLQKN